jgi:hypothetical protein
MGTKVAEVVGKIGKDAEPTGGIALGKHFFTSMMNGKSGRKPESQKLAPLWPRPRARKLTEGQQNMSALATSRGKYRNLCLAAGLPRSSVGISKSGRNPGDDST